MRRRLAAVLFGALVVAACWSGPRGVTTGPDGLRTFTSSSTGAQAVCTAEAQANPVNGVLGGQVGQHDPVWITAADGRHLAVVWPPGFTVKFEPEPVLHDAAGAPVAKAGQTIVLTQIAIDSHAGTFDDPYIASGHVFDGCYPYDP
jgi:hypothetical protein